MGMMMKVEFQAIEAHCFISMLGEYLFTHMDVSQEFLFSLHAVFGFLMNLIPEFKNTCLSRDSK